MEIDFSDIKFEQQGIFIATGLIVVALLLGLLGWYTTPGGQVLTWTEWQVFKQHSQYQRELRTLTRHADRLAGLLEQPPDPVRAQLAVEQMVHDLDTHVTLAALGEQEAALISTGDLVLQWALGSAAKDAAIEHLAAANKTIEKAIAQIAEQVHE